MQEGYPEAPTMRSYGLLWFLAACVLTACLTPAELRATAPVRVSSVAGAYLPLATCVTNGLQSSRTESGLTYQLVDAAATKTARLMATARFPGGLFYTVPAPLLELAFNQADDRTVKIEARRSVGGYSLESASWPIIEQCAGQKATVGPPVGTGAAAPSMAPSLARDRAFCWRQAIHHSSMHGGPIAQFRIREDLFEQCMRAQGGDDRDAIDAPGS